MYKTGKKPKNKIQRTCKKYKKNNKDELAFAQHILNTGHQYGPMEQIMEMVEGAKKR
jgi:uroporphyrinogen-III decarboxylase